MVVHVLPRNTCMLVNEVHLLLPHWPAAAHNGLWSRQHMSAVLVSLWHGMTCGEQLLSLRSCTTLK